MEEQTNQNVTTENFSANTENTYVKTETVHTLNMKGLFPLFFISCICYALFYTFCLYKNPNGITYPLFIGGTLFFFFFCMTKLGFSYKKDSWFYLAAIMLLGISNCLTTSPYLLFMNKTGIFLLCFILMLHTAYTDRDWNFTKYFLAVFETLAYCITCLFRPFSDYSSYFCGKKREKYERKSNAAPIILGIAIAIPLMFVITALLVSADVVFGNMVKNVFFSFDFNFINGFNIIRIVITVFFCSYAVLAALSLKTVNEETESKNNHEPITAIIITGALSFIYLIFSSIQILYLFLGNMQLPSDYSYAEYAREGFFQLLIVCILNLILVLICLQLFKESKILKAILTIISLCTYIMIASSAFRMIMYINAYNLTFLRVFVLWSLAVISFLMAGITALIYFKKFPLFTYSLVIVTVFYTAFSLARPDYLIADYNLKMDKVHVSGDSNRRDYSSGLSYLSTLSSDAAPVILNPDKNPYLPPISSLKNEDENINYENRWIQNYFHKISGQVENMHIRNFNFSVYHAKNALSEAGYDILEK